MTSTSAIRPRIRRRGHHRRSIRRSADYRFRMKKLAGALLLRLHVHEVSTLSSTFK